MTDAARRSSVRAPLSDPLHPPEWNRCAQRSDPPFQSTTGGLHGNLLHSSSDPERPDFRDPTKNPRTVNRRAFDPIPKYVPTCQAA